MKNRKDEAATPFITRDNLFEDIGFSPAEALELKVKSEIYNELLEYIRQRAFTQAELAKLLGLHQPDASCLMNGKVSKFSVGKLIQFAAKLNLRATVKITVPKELQIKAAASKTKATLRRRAAAGV